MTGQVAELCRVSTWKWHAFHLDCAFYLMHCDQHSESLSCTGCYFYVSKEHKWSLVPRGCVFILFTFTLQDPCLLSSLDARDFSKAALQEEDWASLQRVFSLLLELGYIDLGEKTLLLKINSISKLPRWLYLFLKSRYIWRKEKKKKYLEIALHYLIYGYIQDNLIIIGEVLFHRYC